MPAPAEFTPEAVRARSAKERRIPYSQFYASGEPFKSMHAANPWLRAPDYSKPLQCPLYDSGRSEFGGGMGGSAYWDTTVGRKHAYWRGRGLPRETKDIDRLRRDLMDWGYCLVEDGMSREQCAYMRRRLEEQAEAERECGLADIGPFFHIMWTLVNKGDCFAKCVEMDPEWVQGGPLIDQLNEEALGKGFYAYSFASNIAKPYCMPQTLHQDSGAIHPIQTPMSPVLVNTVYIMQDVNEVNGGTLVIPGSHKIVSMCGPGQPVPPLPPAINVEARGGTVVLMDGRLLHGTGANHTDQWRYIMTQSNVKPWMRQQENWMLSVSPEVLRAASSKLKYRMGFFGGLLEVGSYSGLHSTVETRLLLDEGKYTRIPALTRPVAAEQREALTLTRMKRRVEARAAAKARGGGAAKGAQELHDHGARARAAKL